MRSHINNIFFISSVLVSAICKELTGPVFIKEPPRLLEYLATDGGRMDCLGHGIPDPEIKWFHEDRFPTVEITDSNPLIQLHKNGSLTFLPLSSLSNYNRDMHSTKYICSVSNRHGTIISHSVTVRAHMKHQLQPVVHDEYVLMGNTAVLTCKIPTFMKDYMEVVSWIREDNVVIRPQKSVDKMLMTDNGNLLIERVDKSDDLSLGFWCQVKHRFSTDTFLSQTSGKVIAAEATGHIPPAITLISQTVTTKLGSSAQLVCVARGSPSPTYQWKSGPTKISSSPVYIIDHINQPGTYRFTCVAQNDFGEHSRQTTLIVKEPLQAFIMPNYQVINSGSHILLECQIDGYPVSQIRWTFNGQDIDTETKDAVISGNKLKVSSLSREDEGMYQCFVENDWDCAQAAAQIVLGEMLPYFTTKFDSKTLQPGPSVSLECIATGRPTPKISWLLNGHKLRIGSKFVIREENFNNSSARSVVTVRNIKSVDGGTYVCEAKNKIGEVNHDNVINVYGLPEVHRMDNVTVAAGEDASFRCYVSGYPIKSITWTRGNTMRYMPLTSKNYRNGTLFMSKLKDGDDEGEYVCTADNGQGHTSSESFWLNLIVKPKISLVLPPENLEEGNPLTLVCSISSGDGPIKISWLKDGYPVSLETGIDITTTKTYSLLQIHEMKDAHTANYTCAAQNAGGSANRTVEVKVSGPPKWVDPPRDAHAAEQDAIYIPCLANAYPKPVSHWFKIHDDNRFVRVGISNRQHTFQNGTLLFKRLIMKDSGTYRCIVSNGVKHNLQKEITLTIGKKPIIYKLKKIVDEMSRLIIICKVKSDDAANMKWFYDNVPVKNTSTTRISMQLHKGSTVSKLTLDQHRGPVKGNFSCRVESRFGNVRSDIRTSDRERPPITSKSKGKMKDHIALTTAPAIANVPEPNMAIETQQHKYTNFGNKKMKDFVLNDPRFNNALPKASAPSNNTSVAHNHNLVSKGIFEMKSMVMFILPAGAVIILLIVIIITVIVYLITKKSYSRNDHSSRTESIIYDDSDFNLRLMAKMTPRGSTLDRKPFVPLTPRSTLDRGQHCGQMTPPNCSNFQYQQQIQHDGSVIENNYEIPDYYSGLEPYATFELQPRRGTHEAENFYGTSQAVV